MSCGLLVSSPVISQSSLVDETPRKRINDNSVPFGGSVLREMRSSEKASPSPPTAVGLDSPPQPDNETFTQGITGTTSFQFGSPEPKSQSSVPTAVSVLTSGSDNHFR